MEFKGLLKALQRCASDNARHSYTPALEALNEIAFLQREPDAVAIISLGFLPILLAHAADWDSVAFPREQLATRCSVLILYEISRHDTILEHMDHHGLLEGFAERAVDLLSAGEDIYLIHGSLCLGHCLRRPAGVALLDGMIRGGIHPLRRMINLLYVSDQDHSEGVSSAILDAINASCVFPPAAKALAGEEAFAALSHVFLKPSLPATAKPVSPGTAGGTPARPRLSQALCAKAICNLVGKGMQTRWEAGEAGPCLADVGLDNLVRMLGREVPELDPALCFYIGALAEEAEDGLPPLLATDHVVELITGVIHREREAMLEEASSDEELAMRQKAAESPQGGTRYAARALALIVSQSPDAAASLVHVGGLLPLLHLGADAYTDTVLEDVCVSYAACCGDVSGPEPDQGRRAMVEVGGLSVFLRLVTEMGPEVR